MIKALQLPIAGAMAAYATAAGVTSSAVCGLLVVEFRV
jgi:hypothetical protein